MFPIPRHSAPFSLAASGDIAHSALACCFCGLPTQGQAMLEGRLGLDTARLPHADRHGLIYFDRGRLSVESGALTFVGSGGGGAPAGTYTIPHQSISMV